ncbi:MAG: hypothetical protein ABIH24_07455 [Verrucomicrobiota bacterium]
MKRILQGCEKNILQTNAERNAGFFDAEMGKLEHWSEDMKTSLEIKLKQLDIDVKTRKAEARKITNLEEKVKAHREIKDLEKSRNATFSKTSILACASKASTAKTCRKSPSRPCVRPLEPSPNNRNY